MRVTAGHLGDVGVVDVAGEEGDRRGWAAALATGDRHDELEDLDEAGLEGAPVLEVDDLPQRLGRAVHRLGPVRSGEGLADRLGVVQPGRQQEGQRGPDEEVVDVAGQLLGQPLDLGRVEHVALLGLEDARCS